MPTRFKMLRLETFRNLPCLGLSILCALAAGSSVVQADLCSPQNHSHRIQVFNRLNGAERQYSFQYVRPTQDGRNITYTPLANGRWFSLVDISDRAHFNRTRADIADDATFGVDGMAGSMLGMIETASTATLASTLTIAGGAAVATHAFYEQRLQNYYRARFQTLDLAYQLISQDRGVSMIDYCVQLDTSRVGFSYFATWLNYALSTDDLTQQHRYIWE